MDRNKRLRLAQALKTKGEATSKRVGDPTHPTSDTAPTSLTSYPQNPPQAIPSQTLPSPTHTPHSPPSIAVVPLALAETTATPAPLDKGKGVVVLPSDDEKDSAEGQVFKRRRTAKVVTSTSSSNQGADSLREHPPSATSSPQQLALEGGVESEPAPTTPAPKLPPPVQEMLRGYFHKVSPRGQSEGAKKDGMNFYLGSFMAYANTWRDQAKEEASKRLHEAGQAHAELLGQVVPLCVQVVDLKDAVETSKAQQKKLEDHCVDREQKLAKTEAALEAKTNTCDLLAAENTTLRAEMVKALEAKDQELVEALTAKDRELASQAEQFRKAEQELIQDAESAFADGFAEALAQAACANPRINVSECSPFNEIVEGKIVPLEAHED